MKFKKISQLYAGQGETADRTYPSDQSPLSYIKHAVVGDPLYSSARRHFNLDSQALHARLLGFVHPRSAEYMNLKAPSRNISGHPRPLDKS
jgi:hypothetical protein